MKDITVTNTVQIQRGANMSVMMYPSVFDALGFVARKSKDEKQFGGYLERSSLDVQAHQYDGVMWALKQEREGHAVSVGCGDGGTDKKIVRGGLLADEMGLGKTIQMIGTMVCNPLPRTLIVVPRALMEQWEKAILTTTGHAALVFHGADRLSYSLEDIYVRPIVITTYHLIADRAAARAAKKKSGRTAGGTCKPSLTPPTILHSIKWDRIIFDEAHHLRNDGTAVGLGAKKLKADIRWLVTGTPIQNRKSDFYALCEQMGLPRSYYAESGNLMDLVRGFIKKRTKLQVGIELPELRSSTEVVDWGSPAEKDLAENIHAMLQFSHVTASQVDNSIAKMDMPSLVLLIRARQMCVFPELMKRRLADYVVTGTIESSDSVFAGASGTSKLDAVVGKILSRRDNGKGKLVFCHFRGEIDFLQHRLMREGLSVEKFDGRVKTAERTAILEGTCDVLILQIQTGCEGLNLQQFSEIYFVSPHWNPAVEDQAVARCHRIGQKKDVDVFRFAMSGFDEEGKTNTLDAYSASVQDVKRDVMTIIDVDENHENDE